jgi:hypothetical protein
MPEKRHHFKMITSIFRHIALNQIKSKAGSQCKPWRSSRQRSTAVAAAKGRLQPWRHAKLALEVGEHANRMRNVGDNASGVSRELASVCFMPSDFVPVK